MALNQAHTSYKNKATLRQAVWLT